MRTQKCSCSSHSPQQRAPERSSWPASPSPRLPWKPRASRRLRAPIAVLVAARAQRSGFALNSAGGEGLLAVSRPAAAARRLASEVHPPPTPLRGFLGREKLRFCRTPVRLGTVQPRGLSLAEVRAGGPGRRCLWEAPHGKRWTPGFRARRLLN